MVSHGEVVLHRPAAEMRADRALIIASYLGEQVSTSSPAPERPAPE